MMQNHSLLRLVVVVGCFASACATAQLTAGGSQVMIVGSVPSPACTNLGEVIGASGGAMGGYVSNAKLIEYALNDARNKAAALGATHVLQAQPQLVGGAGGGPTSATVSTLAYRCEN